MSVLAPYRKLIVPNRRPVVRPSRRSVEFRHTPTDMALGDLVLDSSGVRQLDALGNTLLSNAAGNSCVCRTCPTTCSECCSTYTFVVTWPDGSSQTAVANIGASGQGPCGWATLVSNPLLGMFCTTYATGGFTFVPPPLNTCKVWLAGFAKTNGAPSGFACFYSSAFEPCPSSNPAHWLNTGTIHGCWGSVGTPTYTTLTINSITVSNCPPPGGNPFP